MDGLHFTVKGSELKEIFAAKAKLSTQRSELAAKQAKQMGENIAEAASTEGLVSHSNKGAYGNFSERALFYKTEASQYQFMVDHLNSVKEYEVSYHELQQIMRAD